MSNGFFVIIMISLWFKLGKAMACPCVHMHGYSQSGIMLFGDASTCVPTFISMVSLFLECDRRVDLDAILFCDWKIGLLLLLLLLIRFLAH